MGCDIHLYLEQQQEDGRWKEIVYYTKNPEEDWYPGRDYFLFGLLAGVRSTELEPIDEPKGLPLDVSLPVAERFSTDDHTPSWLTADEIADGLLRPEVQDVLGPHHPFLFLVYFVANNYPNSRFVFWFDS